MKRIAINQSNKGTGEAFPEGSPEGARRATGGEPSAAKISNFSSPDPEVTGKKPRRKFTAKYKLRMLKKQTHVLTRDNLAFCYAKKGSTRPT